MPLLLLDKLWSPFEERGSGSQSSCRQDMDDRLLNALEVGVCRLGNGPVKGAFFVPKCQLSHCVHHERKAWIYRKIAGKKSV